MKQARRGIFGVWVAPPQSQLSSAEDGTPAKPTHTGGLGYLEGWGWGQSGFHTVPRPCNQPRTGAHWEGAGGTGLQHFQGGGHGSSRRAAKGRTVSEHEAAVPTPEGPGHSPGGLQRGGLRSPPHTCGLWPGPGRFHPRSGAPAASGGASRAWHGQDAGVCMPDRSSGPRGSSRRCRGTGQLSR